MLLALGSISILFPFLSLSFFLHYSPLLSIFDTRIQYNQYCIDRIFPSVLLFCPFPSTRLKFGLRPGSFPYSPRFRQSPRAPLAPAPLLVPGSLS